MPKSECKHKLSPYSISTPSPQAHPRYRSQSWRVCCFLQGNFKSVYGEVGGESLVLFPFFQSLLLHKRWRCRRGQGDSSNYDGDFCKRNGMFQKFA